MSHAHTGSNGYTNGYHAAESSDRYGEELHDATSRDSTRAPRAGGYGGLTNDTSVAHPLYQSQTLPRTRGSEVDPQGLHRRQRSDRGDRDWTAGSLIRERSRPNWRGSRLYGNGPGGKEIEDVLAHIQDRWDIMTKDDCVPVHVALQLMDFSSLGRGNDYEDFQQTSKQLQKALKAIVNEHHQGFNSSIGTFHKIQSSIQTSQSRVRMLKDILVHAKSNLVSAKPELKGLSSSSQSYDEMLHILAQIEKLQLSPEELDAHISSKRFLSAVDILQAALRMIRRSELEDIGALGDLRTYFSNQEMSLTDTLIEELHDHLYLKSPYCQDRWKPYHAETKDTLLPENGAPPLPNTWGRPLYQFLDTLDTSIPFVEDTSQNPEVDNFQYIHLLLESLNKMGRLEVAVDRMEQRLPIELFSIVDRTNKEVDHRHPAHLRGQNGNLYSRRALEMSENSGRDDVLCDLLWTLYSKFEAIAEGHRAMHDIISGIAKREGLRQSVSLTGGFKELWKLYQSEMRSILHDYLAADGHPSYRLGGQPAVEMNIFQRSQRDKSKRVFKLSDIDETSTELTTEQDDLDQILQTSVPGLVSKSHRRPSISGTSESASCDGLAAGHKLLIEPSVFNINLLLPPSLSFLQRLKDIVPPDTDIAMSTLTSFLDDFLINVFHPQLDEAVTELCTRSFIEIDAFQQDPQWTLHAQKPIFKGTSTFLTLVEAFCKMLDTLPQDQTFTELIISQMVTYYDKCCGSYKALVSRAQVQSPGGVRLKTAAALMEGGDLQEILDELWRQGARGQVDLLQKETSFLISKTTETPLDPYDIISDRRSVAALCLLRNSTQWLANRLSQLRHVTHDQTKVSHRESAKPHLTRRWTLLDANRWQDESQPLYLPMTQDTVIAFDGIVSSFRDLGTTILYTLHTDIRCGVIHMITRVLHAHYLLDQPANDADPSVLALNADLVSFDDSILAYLPDEEHRFITQGLALLLDELLVTNAWQIAAMNPNGCGRMQLNILVLQQSLKTIEDDVSLARSAEYFDLFHEGADAIVALAGASGGKELAFNLVELKALVKLCYSEGLQSQQREVVMQAKKGLDDHEHQLTERMGNS
ncbi:MAG: hypothetical protein FRX48_04215 [Lasallia pustulata]|uniref:Exocyst complex component Sec8 n=1 Tax=Lasallia pustulata TaxID=136370 RepID=A0A5M8PSQ9_9LECA|nr:MAG: hypothetical protein FRX48_04215 [Lasallia pustulata]